jgi:shikimate dehydrogenase
MPLLGLIGYSLEHSFSPAYFKQKFKAENLSDWEYQAFPMAEIDRLPELISTHPNLLGFNVTIPHKTGVLKFCLSQSEEVKAIGAANFILIDPITKSLRAYNTDFWGFAKSLKTWYHGTGRAIVFGNGGSSKAIQYALKTLHVSFDVCSRNGALNYGNLDLSQYDLLVNCTPTGMDGNIYGDSNLLDLPYHQINSSHYYYDLVYNPETTAMMQRFVDNGAKVKNGLEMLHLQADKAWEMVKGL